MRFVFWLHNDECMKGLERHKTGMFNEYMRKCFENTRSYKQNGKFKSMHINFSGSKEYLLF